MTKQVVYLVSDDTVHSDTALRIVIFLFSVQCMCRGAIFIGTYYSLLLLVAS